MSSQTKIKAMETETATPAPATGTVLQGLIKQSNDLVSLTQSVKSDNKAKGLLRDTLTKTIIKIMLKQIKLDVSDWKEYRSKFAKGEPLHGIRDILTHANAVVENLGVTIEGYTLTAETFEAFKPQSVYKYITNLNKQDEKNWLKIQENIDGFAFMSYEAARKNIDKATLAGLLNQANMAYAEKATAQKSAYDALLAEVKELRARNAS